MSMIERNNTTTHAICQHTIYVALQTNPYGQVHKFYFKVSVTEETRKGVWVVRRSRR